MSAKKALCVLVCLLTVAGVVCASGGKESAATGPRVLRVAHFYDPMVESNKGNAQWFQDIAAQFEKANPGTKVEFDVFQWDQIDVKMMSDYRSGIKTHDVTLTSPQLSAQHAQVGDLADLSQMVATSWSKGEQSEFNWSAAWKGGMVGDKLYGIALGNHSRVLVYNKDMFKAAGLDPDRPPQTIDELIDYAKKLTTPDVYGLGMYFGPSRATIELYYSPFLWGAGTDTWIRSRRRQSSQAPPV